MTLLNSSFPILLAEDSHDEVLLLKLALRRAEVFHPVQVAEDGQDVIDYLTAAGKYSNRVEFPFPEIILLDIKMPRLNGLEVLRWIKANPAAAVIPTIIFSSSQAERDVSEAYRLGANAYLVKPSSMDELIRRLKLLFEFWSVCVKPTPPQRG